MNQIQKKAQLLSIGLVILGSGFFGQCQLTNSPHRQVGPSFESKPRGGATSTLQEHETQAIADSEQKPSFEGGTVSVLGIKGWGLRIK